MGLLRNKAHVSSYNSLTKGSGENIIIAEYYQSVISLMVYSYYLYSKINNYAFYVTH